MTIKSFGPNWGWRSSHECHTNNNQVINEQLKRKKLNHWLSSIITVITNQRRTLWVHWNNVYFLHTYIRIYVCVCCVCVCVLTEPWVLSAGKASQLYCHSLAGLFDQARHKQKLTVSISTHRLPDRILPRSVPLKTSHTLKTLNTLRVVRLLLAWLQTFCQQTLFKMNMCDEQKLFGISWSIMGSVQELFWKLWKCVKEFCVTVTQVVTTWVDGNTRVHHVSSKLWRRYKWNFVPHSDDIQLLTAQTADCLFVFRKFSISNKIPDTKGCLKCCVGKSYTISHYARVHSLSSRDPAGCGGGAVVHGQLL